MGMGFRAHIPKPAGQAVGRSGAIRPPDELPDPHRGNGPALPGPADHERSLALPDVEEEGARVVAAGLVEAMKGCGFDISGTKVSTSGSLGIALLRPGDNSYEALARADEAMYGAKARGGDGWVLYGSSDPVPTP